MFFPTPIGVMESLAGTGFGTLDLSGDPVVLEPCEATTEAYSGPLVSILGVSLAASQDIALADRTWRAAGDLAEGDAILHWTEGDGVMEPYILPTIETNEGEVVHIVAPDGCLLGASETGPWVLGR